MSLTIFQEFPTEVRLMIWERVPQPRRLVGQMPCSICSSTFRSTEDRNTEREHCIRTTHADWRLRFISQPAGEVVFPPLHACRESRRVWLPRYCRLPRYISLRNHGDEPQSRSQDGDRDHPSYHLRFDIPFISYEADIFTIFDVWTRGHVDLATDEPNTLEHVALDPFMGLDRGSIQHIAIGESAEHLTEAIISLDFHSLPMLRSISVLSYGPAPQPSLHVANLQVEMRPADVQNHSLKVFDIPQELVLFHHMFREGRLRHPQFEPRPHMRHLSNHVAVLKSLMWHTAHAEIIGLRQESFSSIMAFEDFLVGLSAQGSLDQAFCPLEHIPGCGPQGHGREEMVSWVMPFHIDNLMICEESWANDLSQRSISSFVLQ